MAAELLGNNGMTLPNKLEQQGLDTSLGK
jgi:hypothetical protein